MFHRKAANLKHHTSTTGGVQVHTTRMYSSHEWKFSFFSIKISRRVIFGKEVTMSLTFCANAFARHTQGACVFFLFFSDPHPNAFTDVVFFRRRGRIHFNLEDKCNPTISKYLLPSACVRALAVFAGPFPPGLTADTLITYMV